MEEQENKNYLNDPVFIGYLDDIEKSIHQIRSAISNGIDHIDYESTVISLRANDIVNWVS